MRSTPELPDLFRGSDAVREGVLSVSQLRGPRVVRVLRDVYRPAWVPLTVHLASRAAMLVTPPSARITGRTLATLFGVELVQPRDLVEMVVPRKDAFGQVKGLAVRSVVRIAPEACQFRGVRVVSRNRMAFDLAARHRLETAVGHLDAVAHARLVDLDAFSAWLEDRHDNDVRAVRAAVALADARAESIPESVCRVRLVLAGIAVEPQFDVMDRRGLIARADLAIPELKIAIQYQGAWHALKKQQRKDAGRQIRFNEAGWTHIPVTADLLAEPNALVIAVRTAIADAQVARGLRVRLPF